LGLAPLLFGCVEVGGGLTPDGVGYRNLAAEGGIKAGDVSGVAGRRIMVCGWRIRAQRRRQAAALQNGRGSGA
jgi:hypothetical protein